ncbi:tyrosine-type recombinase/integrase [Helicobacter anatolicus]|uniref:tyrosine-type recombinase/integrase n=1 Tax=Helicobacter anatolicus TaxID=2905874 RepID=UPI001E36DB40|nr:site-specific integrase [Helicobacter anatolicus]MCE3040263.1 site-specific integrase [Helicobacter anatolicus]
MAKNITSQKYEGVRSKELNNGDIAYYVRYTNKDGVRKEVKVGNKSDGWNEKRASLKRGELQNQCVDVVNKVLFEEVAQGFLELQKLHVKKKSFFSYRTSTSHLIDFLGRKEISSITLKDLNNMVKTLSESKAPKTINFILDFAKGVFNFAKKEYGIENKAIEEVKRFKVNNNRERFLSLKEVDILRKRVKDDEALRIFVELALCTGARLMGVMSIIKKDIDLQNGEVMINDFKNGSKYIAFLNSETREALKNRLPNIKDEDRVVPKGRRLIVETLSIILNELFNDGITDRKKKVVIHTLRHTFASHLAIKGVPLQIIQKLLNHRDIKMTMRYSHLMPQSGKEYVEKLWH